MGLPSTEVIESAPLPDNYQAAKQVLAECTKVDECKDWADKAVALASYARQVKDESLIHLAKRIHGRAVRRAGELLREVDGRGAHRKLGRNHGTAVSSKLTSGKELAETAGLSRRQHETASAVARIPEEEFEAAVEAVEPPSVTKLAEMGKRKRHMPTPTPVSLGGPPDPYSPDVDHLEGIDPVVFNAVLQLSSGIARLMEQARAVSPAQYAAGLRAHAKQPATEAAHEMAAWLRDFITIMEE